MEWIQPWLIPIIFVSGGLLLGYIAERLVLFLLHRISARTSWAWDNIVTHAAPGFLFFWCLLAGIYLAAENTPLSAFQYQAVRAVLLVVLILSVTTFIAKTATAVARHYTSRAGGGFASATILSNLTRVFVYLLGLLTIFYTFGINVTPALTALGIGGLAVALALQDTLSNFFAGLQIVVSHQITTGDYIKLDSGEEGYVTDITWRNTTLRTLPNNMVVIPNSKLASGIFTNYYLPNKEMAVVMQVGVSYDSDLKKVEDVTVAVAQDVMEQVNGGIPDFESFIRYHTFDESSINFSVILRGKEFVDQHLIKHEFIKRLHERYKKENIVIPFPIRTVHITRNEN